MTSVGDSLGLFRGCVHLPPESDYRWATDQSAIERVATGRTVAFREEVERVLLDLADGQICARLECIAKAFEVARLEVQQGRQGEHALLYSRPRVVECLVVQSIESGPVLRDADRAAAVLAELALGWPMWLDLSEGCDGGQGTPGSVDIVGGSDVRDLQRRMDQRTDRSLKAPRLAEFGGLHGPVEAPAGTPTEPPTEAPPPNTDLEAARLMARSMREAVRLPRPGVRAEDSAVGGYADLSQRGSLDRLLLSELAHDDEVLALRLVLGEALFLQRETSEETLPRERHVLVDASVRAWGEVRLVQMAAALAVLDDGQEEDHGAGGVTILWRALDDRLERLEESARGGEDAGLERFLSGLGTRPHAGAVLQEFFRATEASLSSGAVAERVVVVPARSLKDAAYRAALEAGGSYVISVDAEGRIVLLAMGPRGSRTVRSAQVEVVLPGGANLHDAAFDVQSMPPELPAYLGVWPAPLLTSHPLDGCRWIESAGGAGLVYVILRSKRVLVWTRSGAGRLGQRSGGREIGVLPAGHLRFWCADGDGAAAAIWIPGVRSRLVIASLCSTRPPEVRFLSIDEEPQGFTVHDGVFGLGLRDRVVIASTSSGVISSEVLGRPHAWRQDHARALGESVWRRLRIEESSLRWSRSEAPGPESHRRGAFWRGATPMRLAWIYYSAMIRSPRRISIEFSSSDENPAGELRLLLHGKKSAGRTRALHVRSGAEAPAWESAAAQPRGASLRQRLAIDLASVEQAKHPAARFLLGAQLGNGSRIWSDARGFLHFASPDASLGQLTLALYAEPPFTAWCSLGWKLDASAPLRLKPGQVHPIGDWLLRFLAPLSAATALGEQL